MSYTHENYLVTQRFRISCQMLYKYTNSCAGIVFVYTCNYVMKCLEIKIMKFGKKLKMVFGK